MTIQDPGDPEPYVPPTPDEEQDQDNPFERPPFERDPEAQRAPGAGESDTGTPQPPMQAMAPAPLATGNDEEHVLDAPGYAREAVGNDNIREGKVGGVMGPPHQSMGQGQGG
jgi:hypothetical protein